ncbi:MAG: AsmA family protein, partial [Saprospiraceae bacterium]|nr:AsmA family protein [Saprospiraceae bacterium]
DLAGVAAYRGEGVLSLQGKQLHYQGKGQLGRTTLTTQLDGSLVNGRPRLKGRSDIPVLYLADFGIHPDTTDTAGKTGTVATTTEEMPATQHLFSRKPLDLDYLKIIDLDMDISVDSIDAPGMSAQQLKGHVALDDGRLHIAPMKLIAEGGPTELDLEIDARHKPRFTIKLSADDQILGPWLSQVQNEVPVDGYANYQIFLQGIGASPHELASSLNGLVYLALENVKIPQRYVSYLSADVFGWVMDSTVKHDAYADLDCVLTRLQVENGIITSKVLIADGPRLAVEGKLELNLGAETINMVVLPKQKRRLFSEIAPVRITGDIRDPDVHAIPVKAAATSIGPLFLIPAIPTVAIPVLLFDKLWGTVDDHDSYGGGCAQTAAAKEAAVKAGKGKEGSITRE